MLHHVIFALFYIISTLSSLLSASLLWADENQLATHRPKIGLVLSGGGARGVAHVGVIRVLEELNIPIDMIAGTSMGSIVGGLYASGLSVDELEAVVKDIDWTDAFQDGTQREKLSFRRKLEDTEFLVKATPGLRDGKIQLPAGLIQGQKLQLILKSLTLPVAHIKDFDQLNIPFRAVATDIATGEEVVLGKGDLAMAMRASMSIPSVFAPIEIDGRLLVDGLLVNNLPIDVARNMGADIIIAVNIGTPLTPKDKLTDVLAITDQVLGIVTHSNVRRNLETLTEQDILIVPDLGNFSTADFHNAFKLIPIGIKAAKSKHEKLISLAFGTKAPVKNRRTVLPTIDFLRIDNNSRIADEQFLEKLESLQGKALDVAELENKIALIYGMDLFSSVNYEIVEENGQNGLKLKIKEKPWGPNYLQFGLALASDFDSNHNFSLGASYSRTAVNSLGGEWRSTVQIGENSRLSTEFYQPLGYQHYFITPQLDYRGFNINTFANGEKISQLRATTAGVGLEMGREFGTWGTITLGLRRLVFNLEQKIGSILLPQDELDYGEFSIRFNIDTLDNLNIPHRGMLANLNWSLAREQLSADDEFDQVNLSFAYANTWGRHTLVSGVRLNSTTKGNAPIYANFPLGGFVNLSGLSQGEINGPHSAILASTYYHRISNFHLFPTYVGGTFEFGNAWKDTDDIDFKSSIAAGSLFVAVDSPIGPLYIGYGLAEHGKDSGFLYLGSTF